MTNESLNEKLQELHAELAKTHTVDAEGQALLQLVAQDVRGLLQRAGKPTTDNALIARWRQAVQQFEVSHPTLTLTLEHVLDTLSNMGV